MRASPKGWINTPVYAAALLAEIQMRRAIGEDTLSDLVGLSLGRIRKIKSYKDSLKYPEQLFIESFLGKDQVANMRNTFKPSTSFWTKLENKPCEA